MRKHSVNGILLIYYYPPKGNAATIMEHVNAFSKYSEFNVWSINTAYGFPKNLRSLNFKIIVLHYSLFGAENYLLNKRFQNYIFKSTEIYKIAFFQDEHQYCQQRFSFINMCGINCIYSLLEPQYWEEVYLKYTNCNKIIYTLTGYVMDNLVEAAQKFALKDEQRQIDIGYRTRELPFFMGRGAQEKTNIAKEFINRCKDINMRIDIETTENKRLYGNAWYKFIGNCKAFIGVEAGVTIFDIKDEVREKCENLLKDNPQMSFEEMYDIVLKYWEDNIPYRTISPRHFEAAAFRTCQILFEGKYSGILEPMVHYIPLKKDFTNFEDVISLFMDAKFRHEMIERTYNDLITTERYTYRQFIKEFDCELIKQGFEPGENDQVVKLVNKLLNLDSFIRYLKAKLFLFMRRVPFPGRDMVKRVFKPLFYYVQK